MPKGRGHWGACPRYLFFNAERSLSANMPEPSAGIGSHIKLYPVLGQQGLHFRGDTVVDSGGSASGMVYYLHECYGGGGWDPEFNAGTIRGEFRVRDVFKGKAKCTVHFREKPLEEMRRFAPGIENIDGP